MDFLKALFPDGGSLTFEQLAAKVQEKKLNVVDLSAGEYVSKAKFDDKVNALKGQVSDLQAQIAQRDADLTGLNAKLTEAQADAGKLAAAQTELSNLRNKYDADKTEYENKLSRQAYEFRVRELAGELKFSSASAKKAFIRDALEMNFKQDGETLLGYTDFVAKYKADDPGAFIKEQQEQGQNGQPPQGSKPPVFVAPTHTPPSPTPRKSLSELMAAKNENPALDIRFEKQ